MLNDLIEGKLEIKKEAFSTTFLYSSKQKKLNV